MYEQFGMKILMHNIECIISAIIVQAKLCFSIHVQIFVKVDSHYVASFCQLYSNGTNNFHREHLSR